MGQDQSRTSNDGDQLVHIPCCVLVPHARLHSIISGCLNSAGLLRLRHYLQVWCRLGDLQDLLCQIPKGIPLAMKCVTATACLVTLLLVPTGHHLWPPQSHVFPLLGSCVAYEDVFFRDWTISI